MQELLSKGRGFLESAREWAKEHPYVATSAAVSAAALSYCRYKYKTLDSDLRTHFSTADASSFQGRLVWITGASSGIGRGLALEIAAMSSCTFVLSARNETALAKTKSDIVAANPKCKVLVLPLDLSVTDAKYYSGKHQQILEAFPEHFGVDVLVHNAGYSMRCTAMDLPIEKQMQMMQVMLLSPIVVTNLVLHLMKKKAFGHIVVVSSLTAISLTALRTAYASAKAAIAGYHECLRHEVAAMGIGITNIYPGFVRTNVDVNALASGGQALNQRDDLIQNGMSVERCAQLIICAISGSVANAWISNQPTLSDGYVLHYGAGFFGDRLRASLSKKALKAQGYSE